MKTFLENWDKNYRLALEQIPLFDQNQTRQWTLDQKQLFIKLLYHQRGHFDDILWFMGNFAPDVVSKEAILGNIKEEFGGHAPSHEQLYLDFARSHGVDLTNELLQESNYLPFLREYNQGHLRWLRENNWSRRIIAFAAIERLDNLDYPALKSVALALGTTEKHLVFFNVHMYVTHYENIEEKSDLLNLWHEDSDLVVNVFNFIAEYQIKIWQKISDYVFAYEANLDIVA